MISRTTFAGIAKIGISVACLVLVWRSFAPSDWSAVTTGMDPAAAAAAVAVLMTGQIANGWRHWAILYGLGRRLSGWAVVVLASAGMFFNQVLPSGVGGDVIRVLHIRRRCGWRLATASVLLDRVAGLTFNLLLVGALLPVYATLPIPAAAKAGIALMTAGPLLCLAVGVWAAPRRRLRRMVPAFLRLLPYGLILLRRLVRGSVAVRLAPPTAIGFFSFVAGFALLGEGLGGGPDVLGYLLMVPLIFIAVQIPLSFGGWGIREGAAVVLMPLVGMDPSVAFLASVLFGAAVLATSLPGLAVWALGGFDRRDVPAAVPASPRRGS